MTISEEYLDLIDHIAGTIEIPQISHIFLPTIVEEGGKRDEFGFVFLKDGSAGPFYTGLSGVLAELWQHYPDGKKCAPDTLKLIQYFTSSSLALRSIALGAINALSQHVMQRANYSPTLYGDTSSAGLSQPKAGEKVCMVGCFEPLIEKFRAQDIEVLVLEKNPDRVQIQQGVSLSTNPSDLDHCEHILCTASTLINGSLETILNAKNKKSKLSLIGPSGSNLPDVLFNHGVDSVGGIHFQNTEDLFTALNEQESWGKVGTKYQILPSNYPGITSLLSALN